MLDTEDDFRVLFDAAPDVLFTHDLVGRLLRVNRAFEIVTGYTRSESARMSIHDIVAPEHRAHLTEHIHAMTGGGSPARFDLDIVTRAGERRTLEVSTELIFRDGNPVALHVFGRDI